MREILAEFALLNERHVKLTTNELAQTVIAEDFEWPSTVLVGKNVVRLLIAATNSCIRSSARFPDDAVTRDITKATALPEDTQ